MVGADTQSAVFMYPRRAYSRAQTSALAWHRRVAAVPHECGGHPSGPSSELELSCSPYGPRAELAALTAARIAESIPERADARSAWRPSRWRSEAYRLKPFSPWDPVVERGSAEGRGILRASGRMPSASSQPPPPSPPVAQVDLHDFAVVQDALVEILGKILTKHPAQVAN